MKDYWLSKTIIVNAVVLIIGLLTLIAGQSWVDPEVIAFISVVAIPTLNQFLRWWGTDQPITSVSKTFDKFRPKLMSRYFKRFNEKDART